MDQVEFDKRAVLTSISYAMMELGKGRRSLHNVNRHLKEAINKLEGFATSVGVSIDGPKPEVPVGWNPLMPFTTDAFVWAKKFNKLALVPRRDLVGLPQTCPSVQCPIVRRPDIGTLWSWFTSAIEAGRATALAGPLESLGTNSSNRPPHSNNP